MGPVERAIIRDLALAELAEEDPMPNDDDMRLTMEAQSTGWSQADDGWRPGDAT